MFGQRFRERLGPLRTLRLLDLAIEQVGEDSDEGMVLRELRSSREGRESFQDQISSMMTAKEFGAAPKADGEFIKWLLDWLIKNLPAIIAMFTTI